MQVIFNYIKPNPDMEFEVGLTFYDEEGDPHFSVEAIVFVEGGANRTVEQVKNDAFEKARSFLIHAASSSYTRFG